MNVTVYSAVWCGPCKMLKPAYKKAGIEYISVDIDANLEDANKAQVRGVPTTVITDDDGKQVARIVGFNETTLARVLEVLNG